MWDLYRRSYIYDMYHYRNQGDLKSTSSISGSLSSIPQTNNGQSTSSYQSSTSGRVSIYSLRERVILSKMTKPIGKSTSDAETDLTRQFHQNIPTIRLDSHLTYCLYITLQNLIHLNAIHIILYHAVFWLTPSNHENEVFRYFERLETTKYEETLFIIASNDQYNVTTPTINVYLINKYIYISLIGVISIELIATFIWTLRKKLPNFIQRNPKWRYRVGLVLIGMIISLYVVFIIWLFFHTFITHYLTRTFFFIVVIHFIILTLLDKPNLFNESPSNLFKQSFAISNITRKQQRHSTSSSSTVSPIPTSRLPYRSSTSMPPRKINLIVNSSLISFKSWSRWLSVTEQKLDIHECSGFYTETRQEADELWLMGVRRMLLNLYRTFASFILLDIIPLNMMSADVRPADNQRYTILIVIFGLSTFLTHNVYLFPVNLQTTFHRLATHLGHWRPQLLIHTDTINEWSPECISYTYGNVVKLSSNTAKYYIATKHSSNAAHPQSISHSIIHRLFGNATYFLKKQFTICIILIVCHLFWILRGQFWYDHLIGCLTVLNSSYTIFKITRDLLLLDMADDNQSDEIILTSKQKKSN